MGVLTVLEKIRKICRILYSNASFSEMLKRWLIQTLRLFWPGLRSGAAVYLDTIEAKLAIVLAGAFKGV